MSSPDPRVYKRIGQGLRKFEYAIWDRAREDAVLAGIFAMFSHNLAMKQQLLSKGTEF